jgi:YtkA-like
MRRNLLVVLLGLAFLLLLTWAGSVLVDIIPHRVTAPVQTAQAGPYQITLQVNPNPPSITQPAALTVQILTNSSQQPLTNVRVTLESNMQSMDMGTDSTTAQAQNNGSYLAHVQFAMSGSWQVKVIVSMLGQQPANAIFVITAQ